MNVKGYCTYIINEFGGIERERLDKMLSSLLMRYRNELESNKKVINNKLKEEEIKIEKKRIGRSSYEIEKEELERKLTVVEKNFYRKYSLDTYEQSIDKLLASNETTYYKSLGIARLAAKWPEWHPISQLGENFTPFFNDIGERTWLVEFDSEREDRYFRVEKKESEFINTNED